ncbi:hypothetical protein N658DRAFT_334703 [Parathielavia hyrcaniae]|uniref:Secreted protein n=1 Tax=Parathielavia hyrcaniae TaxID=113614 RepID=A0AAN6PU57_9PEZI|nr:hypothetical protein N658DRAFT_334703 [Parathielavia hyrcaniae]
MLLVHFTSLFATNLLLRCNSHARGSRTMHDRANPGIRFFGVRGKNGAEGLFEIQLHRGLQKNLTVKGDSP